MRILCYILVVLFATTSAVGQQINPVPDYIFRNSMSVGRNAPTDTSAYFSIGPRFGATRGFMPPMVVDTAAVTGTKRNGLLIYSIQRNSFLYWDSTGMRWSRIAANLDTLQLATRAWRQKGDDSLAAIINTRTDTLLLSTRAWRQKGIDSLASVRIGGSGTLNYVPKFSASTTLANSQIFDNGTSVGINTITPSATYRLEVSGADALINTQRIGRGNNNRANNLVLGNGLGSVSTGTDNTGVGVSALLNITSGIANTAIGTGSLQDMTTQLLNTAIGYLSQQNATGSENTSIGSRALLTVSGTQNVSVGDNSLRHILNRGGNAAFGYDAGRYIGSGGNNTFSQTSVYFGAGTRASKDSNSNEIVIGNSTTGMGTNTVIIGNASIANTFLRGRVGVNTTVDAGYQIDVSGNLRTTQGADIATSSGEVNIGKTSIADSGFFKLQIEGNTYLSQGSRLQIGKPVDTTRSLTIIGNEFQVSLNMEEFNPSNSGPDIFIRRGRGTVAQKADIDSNAVIGNIEYAGYSNGSWYGALQLVARTSKADTVGNVIAADLIINQPFASTTQVENMRLFANGGHLRVTGGLETGAPSGGSQKRWKIGEAATVSPTSPNRTLRVEVDGTVYYIHAKTTND